jgi:hypothetical protein
VQLQLEAAATAGIQLSGRWLRHTAGQAGGKTLAEMAAAAAAN